MKKIFNVFALLIVGLVVATGFVSAFGMRGGNEDARVAVENDDFGAWKEAKLAEITEENFDLRVERYNQRGQFREQRELERAAIEANDYETFVELTGSDITEEEFAEIVEGHEEFGGFGGMSGEGRGRGMRGPMDPDNCPFA